MRKVLVTGGAGFVGSHLALNLREHRPDVEVIALDNLKRRGAELNLPRLQAAGVTFIHGDIRTPEDLEGVGEFDWLLECSAEPSVLAGYGGSPLYVINTNLMGTAHCLELARKAGAGVIFLSTSRVYPIGAINALSYVEEETRFSLAADQAAPGVSAEGIAEDFPLEGSRSLYGATKLASELLLQEFVEMYGLPGIINRCGVLSGPWQMGKVDQGVAVFWMARHIFGGGLRYIGYGGQGRQVRDILHVDDLFRLVLHQMDHAEVLSGRTFNVGGGLAGSVSLKELTAICEDLTGNRLEIGSEPGDRAGDIPYYVTDNRRVTEATGWRPEHDVPSIMADIHRWIIDHESALRSILT